MKLPTCCAVGYFPYITRPRLEAADGASAGLGVKPDRTSLFKSVLTNRNHLLCPLLPAAKTKHYLRTSYTRPQNLKLTRKSCHYDDYNIISRMILYDAY